MNARARIVRLPEAVANQIAAGEVVERPASVVKELVENAIDAEASRVQIEIEGGGIELIRIVDDGVGMIKDDAILALERHATSKIREAIDLHAVKTLGFRGEALPSIASVSRFVLLTRPREDTEATRILVEGGIVKEIASAGAAPGTSIEVRDLFYNVPARRKFLKTPQTEVGHISEMISRLALARPDVAFELKSGGRTLLEAPKSAANDPRGRIARILGRAVADRLFAVAPPEKEHAIKVGGFISAPDLSERTARALHVFVNGRYVRDRTIQHAIQDGYRTMLERGRYPVVLLSIDLDPALVDVNVHPQKVEVRFADSGQIHRAVSASLSRTLANQPWLTIKPDPGPVRRYQLTPFGGALAKEGAPLSASKPGAWSLEPEAPRFEPAQLEAEYAGRFGTLEPVGQVMATFLVCQAPDRMVIIDQHAAHERIAFERMKKECAAKALVVQPLLVPMQLELDPIRAAQASDPATLDRLRLLGLELEPFGGNTFLVKSRPAAIGGANLEKLVLDLLDELKDVGETTPMKDSLERLLSCAACHTVVRAGDRLGALEIKALLRAMDDIDFGAHCPHGRPVFVEWSGRELGALFHRS